MKIFNRKYWFFKSKIKRVTYQIWELEFKISKSRQVREGVRQDRDRAIEASQQVTAQVQGATDTTSAEFANLVHMLETSSDNVKRYEAQMKMVDDQINGSNGDETHEPIIGIVEQIKSLVELKEMYKQYLKEI